LLHHSSEVLKRLGQWLPEVQTSPFPTSEEWDLVLRLGDTEDVPSSHTLNPSVNCKNAKNEKVLSGLLKLNGLRYQPHIKASRVYRAYMLDLNCLAIFKRDQDFRFKLITSIPPNREKKLSRIAQRALYALRLHYGTCDIALDDRAVILQVDPYPKIPSAITEVIARGINTYIEKMKLAFNKNQTNDIVLGADPEFVVKDQNRLQLRYASDHFPPSGSVGFDFMRLKVNGLDKHPTAEIRPHPSHCPKILLSNIRKELQRALYLLPDINTCWLAGSAPHPGVYTGGHIHFSNLPFSVDFLKALDNYLAIPSLLMENARSARYRRQVYGFLGEYRTKEHGGIEYRTLSSWLTSPKRALITLCLAKIVATEYPHLKRDLLIDIESQMAFYNADKEYFRQKFPQLWNDIRSTKTYKEYVKDIEPVFRWVMERQQWKENKDFKTQWVLNQTLD
jgi:hypothetical protein